MSNNPFLHTYGFKRYHTLDYYLRERFGRKICKIPLNAGLSCPNRDGTAGFGGCSFCSGGSGDFAGDPSNSVSAQFLQVRDRMSAKWPDAGYVAYFQAGTNTYAPASVLRLLFYEALEQPQVVGLDIATRADCLEEDVLELLEELSRRTWLTVELGLQTVHDTTAQRINRCMTTQSFNEGYAKLAGRGIDVCVHLINGLPGETHEMMVESARAVGALRPHSVKLHLLYICGDTRIGQEYVEGRVVPMEREDYISVVCDQLEVLPPETVISRLTGDAPRDKLLAPMWSAKKFTVINDIDKELIRRRSWQGKEYVVLRGEHCTSD